VGRVYLSLWPADASAAPGARAGSGGVAFQVRDVASDYRRLVDAGVTSLFPPRRTPVGLIARLQDPDGNPVEIVQVPAPGNG
jgi:catechol 2,3-dioxygenase-like lactoylglutathione lyase family enzyme